jgi:hypothetical protein
MTQKNKTILVGIIAIAVWIYAGKEWLGYLGDDTKLEQVSQQQSNSLPSKLYLSQDSYEGTFDYSDPFLSSYNYNKPKESSYSSNVNKTSHIKPVTTGPIIETTVAKKDIKYQGVIQNDKGTLGLLTINGISHVVSKGDFVEEINVLNIEKNQIVVFYNEEKIAIKK